MTLEGITRRRKEQLRRCPVCASNDRKRVDRELAKTPRDVTYQDLADWLNSRGERRVSMRSIENHWVGRHRDRHTRRTRSRTSD